MSDMLTDDDIRNAIVEIHNASVVARSAKQIRVTTEFLTLALGELLSLRQEVARLRAERDAAVAEAVRVERARCLKVVSKAHDAVIAQVFVVPGTAKEVCRAIADAIRRGE